MIQRPKDGIIILGGGRWKAPIEVSIPQTDDSVIIPEFTQHLKGAMPDYVEGWNEHDGKSKGEALNEGLLVDWTGVMGFTPEEVPYVGSLAGLGRTGEYINAGHCGHGELIPYYSCIRSVFLVSCFVVFYLELFTSHITDRTIIPNNSLINLIHLPQQLNADILAT